MSAAQVHAVVRTVAAVYGNEHVSISRETVVKASEVVAGGGLVCLPTDTVYGLAADPSDLSAIRRLERLKGREGGKPNAVMFWDVDRAVSALGPLDESIEAAIYSLLPGPVGLLLPNPHGRFLPACGSAPETVGLRVPILSSPAPGDAMPIAQTSGNMAGQADPRTLEEVPESIRDGVDLVIDGGALRSSPSTIVDLRRTSARHPDRWKIVREGAVSASEISARMQQGSR